MASQSQFHYHLIYILIFVLYIGFCVNFYYTYQLRYQYSNCEFQMCKDVSDLRIAFPKSVKNEDTRESDMIQASVLRNVKNGRSTRRVTKSAESVKLDMREEMLMALTKNESSLTSTNVFLSHDSTLHSLSESSLHHDPVHQHNLRHKKKRLKPRSAAAVRPVTQTLTFEENSGPSVEFFPKPQPTIETQGYVWLTSYSRIPLPVLQEYCLSSKQYCPASEPGPQGPAGQKGNKGDRGPAGEQGPEGIRGLPGPRGPPGNKGEAGLDGREGLPGEPGLDGSPGRDGKNGQNGENGLSGTPGKPGLNGTNGIHGQKGERGEKGSSGMTGLPGPRGKRGPPGINGMNGIPGIQAWKSNGSKDLLIPPTIGDLPDMQQTIIVKEGESLRLKCSASGTPKPDITWRRDDSRPIVLGSVSHTSIEGNRINITRVTRDHIGVYDCIATNGVPPAAIKKYNLEVTFPPLIKIPNQMVGTSNGSYALLQCHVDAFPPPLSYWVYGNNRIIEGNWKYKLHQEDQGPYSNHLTLNITYIEQNDYGMYKCISKNERGKTQGVFTIFAIDPNLPKNKEPEPAYEVYGQPPLTPIETPECAPCPQCTPIVPNKCKGGGRLNEIISVGLSPPYHNQSLKGFTTRNTHCLLSQIGKPVFYRDTDAEWGCWMQDPIPVKSGDELKYWLTTDTDKKLLLEFKDKESFRNKNISKKYQLDHQFGGNSHAMYGGSFYYNKEGTNKVIIFNLSNNDTAQIDVIDAALKPNNRLLYTTQYNTMDISADENGLWIIYASNHTNNTMVMKFNGTQTEYIWNLTLDHQIVGEMFIICGVLYGVESVSDRNTKIDFAFDLYRHRQIDVSIDFTNPFSKTNFISYNPKYQKLFTWDKGNQLEYPVRFNESIDLEFVENDHDSDVT